VDVLDYLLVYEHSPFGVLPRKATSVDLVLEVGFFEVRLILLIFRRIFFDIPFRHNLAVIGTDISCREDPCGTEILHVFLIDMDEIERIVIILVVLDCHTRLL
jgi:hypothetical protein